LSTDVSEVRAASIIALMAKAARTSETSVDSYFTLQYIPEDKSELHIVFECEVLARWRFNLLGLLNPGEEIPKRNLENRLLDLIKGTNLFTQE
jgi:hypothetical protein